MVISAVGLSLIVGYLFGSIPVGLLVVRRLKGVDIRTVGSGRTGGTNALRAAGMKAFITVGVGDGLKGFIPVMLARWIFPDIPLAAACAGIGAMVGVIWSVWIHFRGGAGGASNIGIMVALSFPAALLAFLLGALAFVTVRMASVATLTGCTTAMLALFGLAYLGWVPWAYCVYGVAQLVLVIIALRPNIARIRNGTERRVELPSFGRRA